MDITRKRILHTLNHMIYRCTNEKCASYKDYGGRGISVCKEWMDDHDAFVEWSLANGYEYGLAIDRIDNDKGYSPENCRWVTLAENNQNRRSSRLFTIDGETKNLQQWCDSFGVCRSLVSGRLNRGWDIERALKTPKRKRDTEKLIGMRFGRLTVIRFVGVDKHRYSVYECLCDCGNKVEVCSNDLLTGHNESCGCLKQEICYKKPSFSSSDTHEHL